MKRIIANVWNMEKGIDLIKLPDKKGCYFKNYALDKVTKIYIGIYEATWDYRNKRLKWE